MGASKTENWSERLKTAKKNSLLQDGRRKVHYTFADGLEMTEEYDASSYELLKRRLRVKTALRGYSEWETEIGDDDAPRKVASEEGMVESMSNPIFSRTDRKHEFVFRVRNLPYPVDNYEVLADSTNRVIIIKTKNKKYYKKFAVPDLDRLKLPLEQKSINFTHANNTLIISYDKPKEVLTMEEDLRRELRKMKSTKEGDVECNPS